MSWVALCIVISVPFIAWAELRSWNVTNITALSVFPLLGLWAWSIMWTHYLLGAWRILNPKLQKDLTYSSVTRALALFLIILHPGLLIWSQWKLRGMLPPASIYSYVNSSLKIFVFFGTISLLLFISFDILEKLKNNKNINKHWQWISLSQVLAMVLIFLHSMALGKVLGTSWFEYYWVVLGALLVPCGGLILRSDWAIKSP